MTRVKKQSLQIPSINSEKQDQSYNKQSQEDIWDKTSNIIDGEKKDIEVL